MLTTSASDGTGLRPRVRLTNVLADSFPASDQGLLEGIGWLFGIFGR
jgi:hypothetical protein